MCVCGGADGAVPVAAPRPPPPSFLVWFAASIALPAGIGLGVKCYNCAGWGHLSRDCPDRDKGERCFRCGGFGHKSTICTADVST